MILALSGGVDSSVVAALGARAVGKQMTCVFINHGLLRKGEPEQVEEVFTKQFDVDFIHVHAEDRYAELLAGVTEPEEKRRIIGTQFWKSSSRLLSSSRPMASRSSTWLRAPSTPTSSSPALARRAARRPPSRAITT